jgi:hypothetical protein
VLAKLNLSSRVEAAVYAVKHEMSSGKPRGGAVRPKS